MRRLTIVVALVSLSLAGAGCGGDDESGSDTDTIVATDTTTTEETTTDETATETETDTTETDVSGGLSSGECRELANAGRAIGPAFDPTAGSSTDIKEAADSFQAFAERVPEEIRDAYRVLADAFAAYAAAYEDAGLEPGETPTVEQAAQIAQAFAAVDLPAVVEASQQISTWATYKCPSG